MREPENDPRVQRLLAAYAAQERRRLAGEPPDLEAVLAFVEGRLAGEERERVADAITAFPEVAELARELAAFESDEDEPAPAPADSQPPDWPQLRDRLAAAGWPGAGAAASLSAPASIGDRLPPTPSGGRNRWWAAAAALVAVVAGYGAGGGFVRKSPDPNPLVATLRPAGGGGARGVETPAQRIVARASDPLVMVLAYAGGGDATTYRLDLVDAAGSRLWSTDRLRRGEAGEFTVGLPPGFLDPGSYRLELRASGAAGDEPPLEAWEFSLELE